MAASTKFLALTLSFCAASAVFAFGCAGAKDNELDDDNVEVAELNADSAALESPDGDADDDDADQERGRGHHKKDKGDRGKHRHGDDDVGNCHDDDGEHHRGHRHHLFRVLDRLDGTRDKAITIASLPPQIPALLVAGLHAIDANGDGVVTKDEAKAARHGVVPPPPPAPAPVVN